MTRCASFQHVYSLFHGPHIELIVVACRQLSVCPFLALPGVFLLFGRNLCPNDWTEEHLRDPNDSQVRSNAAWSAKVPLWSPVVNQRALAVSPGSPQLVTKCPIIGPSLTQILLWFDVRNQNPACDFHPKWQTVHFVSLTTVGFCLWPSHTMFSCMPYWAQLGSVSKSTNKVLVQAKAWRVSV